MKSKQFECTSVTSASLRVDDDDSRPLDNWLDATCGLKEEAAVVVAAAGFVKGCFEGMFKSSLRVGASTNDPCDDELAPCHASNSA